MEELDLGKIKLIEMNMLKEFISICKRHNFCYFMLGGSCLGAVRHKGFIPWDDDIDVGMPRPDYEQFLKVAQAELPPDIFLQTRDTDPEYIANFAKLRNNNTTFIEKSVSKMKINHGVYMDIFPLDGFTEKKVKREWMLFKKSLYGNRIYSLYDIEANKSLVGSIKKIIAFICSPNVSKTISKLEKLYKKFDYKKEKIIVNHCGAWGRKEIVPKEYFGEGTEGMFEGIKVELPNQWHNYLTQVYGDYMTLPPPEQRVSHHDYTVLDLEKSYKEYINQRS